MPTNTISPFEIAYASIKAAIDNEFPGEGVAVIADELHESLGATEINVGIAPLNDAPMNGGRPVQETWIHVQWFDLWDPQINPTQIVDPIPITRKAERLRLALRSLSTGLGNKVWYFNIEDTQYPRDPTGNKTRFVMRIRAYGNNASISETGP